MRLEGLEITPESVYTVRLPASRGRGDAETLPVPRSVAVLRLLWRGRGTVARAIVFGAVAATILAFSLSRRFESTMRLMPPESPSYSALERLGADMDAGGLSGLVSTNRSGALWIDLLKSRSLGDRMIERFDLKKIYRARLMQTARTQLANSTVLNEDLKSGIIAVTVTDESAQRAAAMSNAYAEELNRILVEQATSSARRERLFLENRLKLVRLDLDSAAKKFSDFSSKNAAIDMDEQGASMMESAAALNAQLIARKSELASLEQVYTDGNARVREESAGVREFQSRLDGMSGRPGADLSASSQRNDSVYPSIRELPLLGVASSDLSRNKEIQENLYESLSQLLELAKIQEARETPSVKILDRANVPERKSFPPRLEIVFMGILFSGVGGIAWILAKERWQRADPWETGARLRFL
ncbi:MAG TPA: GNVR domain-containing protein [Terriglobales bacterium]|nr:GNVR domain-containing protein [Terriglobales bacterium]